MPIVMSVGPWATSPHARTRAEPNRAGCGWRAPTTCGHECSSVQGLVGPATFCFLFFIFYLFKILLRFFGKSWTRSRESDLRVATTRAWSQILSGCFKQKDLQRVINTQVLHVSFTWNRNQTTLFLPQISYTLCSCDRNLLFSQRSFSTYGQRISVWAEAWLIVLSWVLVYYRGSFYR